MDNYSDSNCAKYLFHYNTIDMEVPQTDQHHTNLAAKGKNSQRNHYSHSGRSLNPAHGSKNAHDDPSTNRGHVSEVLHPASIPADSANKSENVIASMEKHRNTKSNNKTENGKKSLSKNSHPPKISKSKNRNEASTV